MRKVNVLGTKYNVKTGVKIEDDPRINNCDGFCDFTTKEIVVAYFEKSDDSVVDLQTYTDKVVRHELVHAFLYESGLDVSSDWARNEEIVDWIAIQFPKMFKVYDKLEVM